MASRIWRNTILEPRRCSHCDAKSWLFRIYPLSGMEELRSYECSACHHVDDYRVAGEPMPSWRLIEADPSSPRFEADDVVSRG